jgi:hypothetical protein
MSIFAMCSFGGETSFTCSNLIKLAKIPYFISLGHFEHLLALVFVTMYTWWHQLEHSFNLLAIILKLLHLYIFSSIACFKGELQSLGSSLISACVNKGERYVTLTISTRGTSCQQGEKVPIPPKVEICIHLSEIAFVQGELHLSCFSLLDVLSLCLFWRV